MLFESVAIALALALALPALTNAASRQRMSHHQTSAREPATVTAENWTYKLPWLVDGMGLEPEARARKERLRAWSVRYGRI